MKSLKWIFIALAIMASAFAWQQRETVKQAQARLRNAETNLTETRRLEATNAYLRGVTVSSEELAQLRAATTDLHKLRNKVRQLRSAMEEMEQLKRQNAHLLDAIAQAKTGKPVRPPGFIERSALANVGQATPEAAIQKFFWALVNTNSVAFLECMIPEARESITKVFSPDNPNYAETMAGITREMANFPGFHISSRNDVSDTEVELKIGTETTPDGVSPILVRIGNSWYMKEANGM